MTIYQNGDMLELGERSIEYHKILGAYIINKNIDAVFAYGNFAKYIVQEMENAVFFHQFYSKKSTLIAELKEYLQDNDIIYLKGSRSMEMENIIKELKI